MNTKEPRSNKHIYPPKLARFKVLTAVAEYSCFLGCNSVTLDKLLRTFRTTAVSTVARSNSRTRTTAWLWRRRHYGYSKRYEPMTDRRRVISQATWLSKFSFTHSRVTDIEVPTESQLDKLGAAINHNN